MAILEIHEDGDLDGVFTFDIMKLIHIAKARLTISITKTMFATAKGDNYWVLVTDLASL